MKNVHFLTLSIGLTVILAIAFVATGFFSYRAYSSSTGIEKVYLQSIQTLKKLIDSQEVKIASLSKQIAVLESRLTANTDMNNLDSRNKLNDNGKSISMSSEELQRLKQSIASTEREQLRLSRIIESTGLEQLEKTGNIDPTILSDIYGDRAERNLNAFYRETLLEQNKELHLADKVQYDEELTSLYQRARPRGGRDTNSEDSDKAFNELLAKYPDAYATAMVIGERALYYTRRNTAEAEKYYFMLRKNENESFTNVVTDQGIEAMPNIEYNLANRYIREGRMEEANSMLDSLEKNYSNSILYMVRRGSGPRLQSVSQGVTRLRDRLR